MARPMILMQEYLLSLLWNKRSMGVPITTIIEQDDIPLTPPTLKKLLDYMNILEQEEMKENPDTYQLVYNSLFPSWLTDLIPEDDSDRTYDLVTQPFGWKYIGQFPIGKWCRLAVEPTRECDGMVDIEDLKSSA